MGWNKKILDYEIETKKVDDYYLDTGLGWNKKILDYEIETAESDTKETGVERWNKKILDYEIETPHIWKVSGRQIKLK